MTIEDVETMLTLSGLAMFCTKSSTTGLWVVIIEKDDEARICHKAFPDIYTTTLPIYTHTEPYLKRNEYMGLYKTREEAIVQKWHDYINPKVRLI